MSEDSTSEMERGRLIGETLTRLTHLEVGVLNLSIRVDSTEKANIERHKAILEKIDALISGVEAKIGTGIIGIEVRLGNYSTRIQGLEIREASANGAMNLVKYLFGPLAVSALSAAAIALWQSLRKQ